MNFVLNFQRRNFRQVLENLRTESKLKHVNYTKTSIEYELTPYEMLMVDIRRKNYELNKVSHNFHPILWG